SLVARGRLVRHPVQAEQVLRRPAERGGLLVPLRQEPAAILHHLLPAIGLNVIRTAMLKDREDVSQGLKLGRGWIFENMAPRVTDRTDKTRFCQFCRLAEVPCF